MQTQIGLLVGVSLLHAKQVVFRLVVQDGERLGLAVFEWLGLVLLLLVVFSSIVEVWVRKIVHWGSCQFGIDEVVAELRLVDFVV